NADPHLEDTPDPGGDPVDDSALERAAAHTPGARPADPAPGSGSGRGARGRARRAGNAAAPPGYLQSIPAIGRPGPAAGSDAPVEARIHGVVSDIGDLHHATPGSGTQPGLFHWRPTVRAGGDFARPGAPRRRGR